MRNEESWSNHDQLIPLRLPSQMKELYKFFKIQWKGDGYN